ncbi:glycoside hydrolase domain-containing protein [Planococcus halocryophilus]|uniref:glycoside hydrolase domain-containing protein n=1 Tax=Planococcus halocryophilus TaxID=1215089 RepID=UPI001F0EEA5D|nr:glycoside hydrolase domain-containing protein [Planococcus halocryophilus]MCH4825185.1 DUF1906 domain-containing protein [Planococcus halocryophilus]
MDSMVFEVQQWVNLNYLEVPGYIPAPENGKTGWSTMYSLTMALQHELGISPVIESFGPSTQAAYEAWGEVSMGYVPNTLKGLRIVMIIQGACWCKGYNPGGFSGTFGAGTKSAIIDLQTDVNLPIKDGKVYGYIFKALLSMDAYVQTTDGDPKIREMQRDLNYHYFSTAGVQPTDGHYQRGTNRALIYGIQTEQGIPASQQTGSPGPTTRDRLPLLQYGRSGVFVKLFQYALYVNNYDTGSFDGIFGRGTESVVKEFQAFVKLTPDGYVGKQTWLSALVSTGDSSRKGTALDCITEITPERAQTLVDAGYETVGRYIANSKLPNSLNKKIQPGELKNIFNAGLTVFPIFQMDGRSTDDFSIEKGRRAAADAYTAARKYGFKEGTTIYFAVDYDAQDGEIDAFMLPYFKGINEQMGYVKNFYKIGVYGSRNVCIRVSNAGYADTSFVSGMSTGFSGNLGYPLPENWAFDQISTIILGYGAGLINIDNNIKSGKYNGESSVESLPDGSLNESFMSQLNSIYEVAVRYKELYDTDKTANELVTNYYRRVNYDNLGWDIISGEFDQTFEEFVHSTYGPTSFLWPVDPVTQEEIDVQHLMATLSALQYGRLIVNATFEDFAGWAGDLVTLSINVMDTRDADRYYSGDLLNRTYESAYEHMGSATISSYFTLTDLLADVDAVNIAKYLQDNVNATIVESFRWYYSGPSLTRYKRFYNTKYDSNEEQMRKAADDIMTYNHPLHIAGRGFLKLSNYDIPTFTDEEGAAIAKGYADKMLIFINNENNI